MRAVLFSVKRFLNITTVGFFCLFVVYRPCGLSGIFHLMIISQTGLNFTYRELKGNTMSLFAPTLPLILHVNPFL